MTARDIVLAAAGGNTTTPGWQLITLTGTYATYQFAYGNGYYVAIGDAITHQPYSPDLKRWFPTNRLDSSARSFVSIAFGNNTFVAVGGVYGGTGIVSTMTDPTVGWTNQATPAAFVSPNNIANVAFGAGVFVATGNGGKIATSPDGITWTTRTSGTTDFLSYVRYVNSLFIIVGTTTTGYKSPDGITWTPFTLPVAGGSNVDYGNGYYGYTDGGQLFYRSTDLVTWSAPISIAGTIYHGGLATNGTGTWVTTGNSTLYQISVSTDNGLTWDFSTPQRMSNQQMLYYDSPNYLNGNFVATGGTSTYGIIIKSTDGKNWARSFNAGNRTSLYVNNKFWLGGGGNGSFIVFDPVTNNLEYANFPQPIGAYYVLLYFSGYYVVAGQTGLMYTIPIGYDYQNSNNWTTRTSGFGSNLIQSGVVNSAGTVAVIVGAAGNISSSTDGITWTARTSGTANALNAVMWFSSKFVAVGAAGTLVTSTDGTTWTVQTAIAALTFQCLAMTSATGTIMAIDTLGAIYTSTDGITWVVATSPFAGSSVGTSGLTYGKGLFYASTTSSASIYKSSDSGASWTQIDSPKGYYQTTPTDTMNSIIYGGGYLAAVGGVYAAPTYCVAYYQKV